MTVRCGLCLHLGLSHTLKGDVVVCLDCPGFICICHCEQCRAARVEIKETKR